MWESFSIANLGNICITIMDSLIQRLGCNKFIREHINHNQSNGCLWSRSIARRSSNNVKVKLLLRIFENALKVMRLFFSIHKHRNQRDWTNCVRSTSAVGHSRVSLWVTDRDGRGQVMAREISSSPQSPNELFDVARGKLSPIFLGAGLNSFWNLDWCWCGCVFSETRWHNFRMRMRAALGNSFACCLMGVCVCVCIGVAGACKKFFEATHSQRNSNVLWQYFKTRTLYSWPLAWYLNSEIFRISWISAFF